MSLRVGLARNLSAQQQMVKIWHLLVEDVDLNFETTAVSLVAICASSHWGEYLVYFETVYILNV